LTHLFSATKSSLRHSWFLLLALAGLFVLFWQLSGMLDTAIMSLPMHIISETFAIIVSMMIFAIIYAAPEKRPLPLLLLGCAFLMVGLLDLLHTLSFQGMPAFITPSGPEKGMNFWLAARLIFVLAMLAFPLLPWRPLAKPRNRSWLLATTLVFTLLICWLGLYYQELWPATFSEGQGLTPFKIGAEYALIAMMLCAALLFYQKARSGGVPYDAAALFVAMAITILSELTFTRYSDVFDSFNLLGHFYKILAYIFIYKAIFVVLVQDPFQELHRAIRALQQSEAEVKQSKEYFRIIMDSLDALVYVADMKTHEVLFVNAYGQKQWGDVVGKRCWQVLQANQTGPCPFCTNDRLVDAEGNPLGVHVWEFKNTVTQQWYDCRDQAILWPDGRLVRLEIATDITRRQQAEIQVRQAQKMESIGALAGGIAHDFNNILSAISGYTELAMMRKKEDVEAQRQDLQQVRLAAARAATLVRQILTFSRRQPEERKPVQISLIVNEVLKLLRASIPTTIEIRQQIISQAMVLVDPVQIHQLVMNLATNAYQAMQEEGGGVLEFTLKEIAVDGDGELAPGPYVMLAVRDTGCGMEKAMMAKIFEPYYTTKEVGYGTGLGLSVVHGIVKSHKGKIGVHSEVGRGTTFKVFLPMVVSEEAMTAIVDTLPPLAKAHERIMVVDDEEAIRDLLNQFLSQAGYGVEVFADGVQAWQAFRSRPDGWDLILTDQTMPKMTGDQLVAKVLALRPELPIIICSGYSQILSGHQAKKVGAAAFLQKPLNRNALLIQIARTLAARAEEENDKPGL